MEGSVNFFTDRVDSWMKRVTLHLFGLYLGMLIDVFLQLIFKLSAGSFDEGLLAYFPHYFLTDIIYFGSESFLFILLPERHSASC